MKLCFRFILGYLAFSVLLVAVQRQQGLDMLIQAGVATYHFATEVMRVALMLIVLALAIPVVMGWRRFVANLGLIGYAILASTVLQTGFSLLKSSIPVIVPFYADPALAEADHWLHGGVDPWAVAHRIGAYLPMDLVLPVYMSVWAVPAIGLAVILAVAEHDAERRARFLLLYLFCWIVIGNVLAIAASSVGPVFYDALLGGDRFAALTAALEESGVAASRIGLVQQHLWNAYGTSGLAIGTGISAFPSVHVGIAALTALYLFERNRWLGIPGLAFLAVIQFLSVYTGYHYALDGYVSIALVASAWIALRRVDLTTFGQRWERRGPAATASASEG